MRFPITLTFTRWGNDDRAQHYQQLIDAFEEELSPKSGFGASLTASEASWSNFLGGYLADSGAESVTLVAPPTEEAGSKDLHRQAGLQVAISAGTEHPEAAPRRARHPRQSRRPGG